MKVHLIRSEGFKMEDYNNVFNILNQYSGGITFVPSEPIVLPDTDLEITYDDAGEYEGEITRSIPVAEPVYSWHDLFAVCNQYRMDNMIPSDEQVFLLTDKKNEENWFGAMDEHTMNNFFVDCSDWHRYFKGFDIRFPITYCISGWLLRKVIFASGDEMRDAVHIKSIGCLMDFCQEKKEIALKMRTADICDQCLSYSEKNDSNRVYMNQLIQIMDGVRSNLMFRDRSKYLRTNSRIEFRGMMHKIYLTDLGDLQVNLNPTERALYLVFINHPEGISRADLIDFRSELIHYYAFFSNSCDNNQINEAVDLLTNALEQKLMQVLSRIRRKFKDTVGEEQYKTYSIESHDGKYKILLDRELVSYDTNAKLPTR